MEKSKVERRAEVADYTMEQLRKIYTGFMPYSHVVEGFWNFNKGLKQQRLMNFVESLKLVFESKLKIKLDSYDFQSEDFVDLFESIMKEVQTTKSIEKLNAFRGIFINSLILDSFDLTQVYIDLTTSLHEKQIEILNIFISTNEDRKNISKKISELSKLHGEKEANTKRLRALTEKGTIESGQSIAQSSKDEVAVLAQLEKAREEHKRIVDSINPIRFGIESSKFNYFVRDLISKGLLVENTYVSFASNIVDSIDATDFAIDYYKFVTIDD